MWNRDAKKRHYLIINAVKHQKFHGHLSIVLELLGDFVRKAFLPGIFPQTALDDFPPTNPTSKPWLCH